MNSWISTALLLVASAQMGRAQCAYDVLVHGDPQAAIQQMWFGYAVDIDGDLAVVGAPYATGSLAMSGAAAVFERGPLGWNYVTELSAPVEAGSLFGEAVAICGERIVVGARYADLGTIPEAGRAFVYERLANTWTLVATLLPTSANQAELAGIEFGQSVDVDGDRIVVGAWEELVNGVAVGAAHVFEQSAGTWIETARLVPGGVIFPAGFGISVAIAGSTAFIGAPLHDGVANGSGAVFVYGHDGSAWAQDQVLFSPASVVSGSFGRDLALEGDLAVVGAPGEPVAGAAGRGAAYAFERLSESPGTPWVLTGTLLASDGLEGDNFGNLVSLSGPRCLIGAPFSDGHGTQSGSAYLFELQGGGFAETMKLEPGELTQFNTFGLGGALSETQAIVGAFQDLGADGVAYAYDFGLHAALEGDVASVSLAGGGTQTLVLRATPSNGGQIYVLLGSASGTSPGILVDGLTLPLNLDAYLLFTLVNHQVPPISAGLGGLDSCGMALAGIVIPAGSDPGLAGITLHHAFALVGLDSSFNPTVEFASNAVALALTP